MKFPNIHLTHADQHSKEAKMLYDDDTSRRPGFEILSPEEAWKEDYPKVTVDAKKTKLIQDLRHANPGWSPGQIIANARKHHSTQLTLPEVHTVVKAMS